MSDPEIRRAALALAVAALILAALCAPAGAMQYVNLPKYDIELTLPQPVNAGDRIQVQSHVVLLYYQMGTDPSVPDIYVEYELKGPTGAVVSTASGVTDGSGVDHVEIAVPSTPGEYTVVARAYDTAGGPVNGQNEAMLTVRPASGATVSPATATPRATPMASPPVPTSTPPTAMPTAPKPLLGGLLGTTEILLIVAALIGLFLVFLALGAVLIFLLFRKKKPAPVKPAAPLAIPPAPEPPERYCMHCGAPMGKYVASCTSCGQTPPSGTGTKDCSACHTAMPEAAKFCHKCGAKQP